MSEFNLRKEPWGVAIIGMAPEGPWRLIIARNPAAELRKELQFVPSITALIVREVPTHAWAAGVEQEFEKRVVEVRGRQNLRAPSFLMSAEKTIALLDAVFRVLNVPARASEDGDEKEWFGTDVRTETELRVGCNRSVLRNPR